MNHRGHAYVQRTYIHGDHRYACAYRRGDWRGWSYYSYVPAYYYHPVFYSWAYHPWIVPVHYGWGWYAAPWYSYYGFYFAPAPVYPTASLWLADYLLAANLAIAYDTQQEYASQPYAAYDDERYEDSGVEASGLSATLSREVKQAIAVEVEQQLESQQREARQVSSVPSQSDPELAEGSPSSPSDEATRPAALDPSISIFVVSSNLVVTTEDGHECELSGGDVVSRIDDVPGADNAVQVRVTASKNADCATGTKPRIQIADLQEMHNQFRQQLDSGLKKLADGGDGLPRPPETTTTAAEVPPPYPEDAEAAVQQLQREADQTERQVAEAGR